MAVAVQSVSTVAYTGCDNGQTITITKPTGTADGDLLIAHIGVADNTGSHTPVIAPPAGWTALCSQNAGTSGTAGLLVFYKVASSEGASYVFTNSSGFGVLMGGAILRINGQGGTPSIQYATDGDTSASTTPAFTTTVTPVFPNSLCLMLTAVSGDFASGTSSGYNIATDNPSWTEQYDQYGSGAAYFGAGDGDGQMSGASAVRTQVTATGNASLTLSNAWPEGVSAMVIIPPLTSVTVSPTVLSAIFSVIAPAITGAANITVSVLSATFSVIAPVVSFPVSAITNAAKHVSSWLNSDKS